MLALCMQPCTCFAEFKKLLDLILCSLYPIWPVLFMQFLCPGDYWQLLLYVSCLVILNKMSGVIAKLAAKRWNLKLRLWRTRHTHLQCERVSRLTVFAWCCWWRSGICIGLKTSLGVCWLQGHGLPQASCTADPDLEQEPDFEPDVIPPSASGCCSPTVQAIYGQELPDNLFKDTSRLNVHTDMNSIRSSILRN